MPSQHYVFLTYIARENVSILNPLCIHDVTTLCIHDVTTIKTYVARENVGVLNPLGHVRMSATMIKNQSSDQSCVLIKNKKVKNNLKIGA